MAKFLNKENPVSFTFHSFRRTSATMAADSGATSQQLQYFFGWKNPGMCSEYVSTSKAALTTMASHLSPEKPLPEEKMMMAQGDISEMSVSEVVTESPPTVMMIGDDKNELPNFPNAQKVVVIYGFNGHFQL